MDEADDRGPANACVRGETVESGDKGRGLDTNAALDLSPTRVDCLEVLAVAFVAVMISNVVISC